MLDEETGTFYAGDKIINLTFMETILLSYLIQNKNRIIKWNDLICQLYVYRTYEINEMNKTYQLITRLQEKIKKYCKIMRIKGKGVRIEWIGQNL